MSITAAFRNSTDLRQPAPWQEPAHANPDLSRTEFMTKAKSEVTLSIALTRYGWALDTDAERLGLFVTQKQAVTSAKLYMRTVKANGISSKLVVTGNESDADRRKVVPFARLR